MQKEITTFRTIREVAEIIDVPQHVLRFWETRFPEIKPLKHNGGRRYYAPEDIELLQGIRHLLYKEGYTIRGVQRVLREEGAQNVRCATEHSPPPERSNSISSPDSPLSYESVLSEHEENLAQPGSRENIDHIPPLFPARRRETQNEALPSLPIPPLTHPSSLQVPHSPPELFLGLASDPTSRTKMGDDPHFRTTSEQQIFLCHQLRQALDHLKECKHLLGHALEKELPFKTS